MNAPLFKNYNLCFVLQGMEKLSRVNVNAKETNGEQPVGIIYSTTAALKCLLRSLIHCRYVQQNKLDVVPTHPYFKHILILFSIPTKRFEKILELNDYSMIISKVSAP